MGRLRWANVVAEGSVLATAKRWMVKQEANGERKRPNTVVAAKDKWARQAVLLSHGPTLTSQLGRHERRVRRDFARQYFGQFSFGIANLMFAAVVASLQPLFIFLCFRGSRA